MDVSLTPHSGFESNPSQEFGEVIWGRVICGQMKTELNGLTVLLSKNANDQEQTVKEWFQWECLQKIVTTYSQHVKQNQPLQKPEQRLCVNQVNHKTSIKPKPRDIDDPSEELKSRITNSQRPDHSDYAFRWFSFHWVWKTTTHFRVESDWRTLDHSEPLGSVLVSITVMRFSWGFSFEQKVLFVLHSAL